MQISWYLVVLNQDDSVVPSTMDFKVIVFYKTTPTLLLAVPKLGLLSNQPS